MEASRDPPAVCGPAVEREISKNSCNTKAQLGKPAVPEDERAAMVRNDPNGSKPASPGEMLLPESGGSRGERDPAPAEGA